MPRSKVDPGRSCRPHQFGPFVLASETLKPSPSASSFNEAVSSFGEYGLSCGLRVSLCTLQLTCSVFTSSVAVATLGRSGWLILTPQGLSPCKKRQASLGAPAIRFQPENQSLIASADCSRLTAESGKISSIVRSERLSSDAIFLRDFGKET